ncbi:MAG: ubiquinol-cytochrome C chaperone family protein [Beijerinckiaceae bacterium]
MLGLFRKSASNDASEVLHTAIVEAARRPDLYAALGVPDTPWGRIESVMLHTMLVVRRLSGAQQPLAHALVERMFTDFDRGLRQVGVGDLSVPKKMKELGSDWLGRVEAYGPALDAGDEMALAAALARNVLENPDQPERARDLSRHVLQCDAALRTVSDADIAAGRLNLPAIVSGSASP